MITLYSGTPGSGKSLHTAKIIFEYANSHKDHLIFVNFEVDTSKLKHPERVIFCPNSELNTSMLIESAIDFFKSHKRKEGSLVLILDECQLLFNSRSWNDKGRMKWLEFFSQHRKYCFDVFLIAQYDIMIDKQFRTLIEYEVVHRKITNSGIVGFFLYLISFGSLFMAVTRWYSLGIKTRTQFFKARRKYYCLYDTFAVFEGVLHNG